MIMAMGSYGGTTLGKLGLSALGKASAVSATAFALTLGTVVLVVVAGALVVKEIMEIEVLNKENTKAGQASGT